MEWTKDNRLVYTSVDELYRPCQVFVHTLGEPTSKDVKIFEEKDDSFFVDIVTTKDKACKCRAKKTSAAKMRTKGDGRDG